MNTVRKRNAINNMEDPNYCVWLQEMAEQGYIFKKEGFIRSTFEISRPEKRRYRILDKAYDSMDAEEKALYEESGWMMADKSGSFTIMTCNDPKAPEIYSDSQSYLKSIRGRWIGKIAVIAIWGYWLYRNMTNLLEQLGVLESDYSMRCGRLHNMNGASLPLEVLMLLGMIIFVVYIAIYISGYVRLLRRDMDKELPRYDISYDDPRYLRAKSLTKAQTAMLTLMLIILPLALAGYMIDESKGPTYGSEALAYKGEHPVMLREADPVTWAEMVPLIENYEVSETNDINYDVYEYGGTVIKKTYREQLQYDVRENPDDEMPVISLYWYSSYNIARNERLAEEYLDEEISNALYGKVVKSDKGKALKAAEIDVPGVDYAGYTDVNNDDLVAMTLPEGLDGEEGETVEYLRFADGMKQQNLYLRRGNVIEIIKYFGPADIIKESMELFVRELNE